MALRAWPTATVRFAAATGGIGERFLNRYGSPNSCGQDKVCYGTLTLAESLTYGFGPSVFAWPVTGVTRCIVLWGMRPIASAPLLWRAISRAHRAGAKLIVIDPLRTQEAQRADLWLAPLPGSDAALALALLKVMVERRWFDADFVREQCVGFEALATHLAAHSLAALAAECAIDVDIITGVAEAIGCHGPTVINAGNGLCQSGTPALHTARAIANLIAISGSLGRAGAHQLAGGRRATSAPTALMLDADHLPPAQQAKRLGADRFAFLGHGYRDVDAAMASAWHGHRHALSWIATAHEPSLWRAITDAEPYAVKALVVQHHNPLGANANAAAAARALMSEQLDLLVVQDLFHTPTSALADYLLPAAHWLEKPYFSLGIAFVAPAGDFVAANHAALETNHEHHSDYDLWRDLAQHLGQGRRVASARRGLLHAMPGAGRPRLRARGGTRHVGRRRRAPSRSRGSLHAHALWHAQRQGRTRVQPARTLGAVGAAARHPARAVRRHDKLPAAAHQRRARAGRLS
jgi:thiosulfate reductase/polysulfide reductase chain A